MFQHVTNFPDHTHETIAMLNWWSLGKIEKQCDFLLRLPHINAKTESM